MSTKAISEYFAARDRGERVAAPKIKLTQALVESLPTKPYDYSIGELTVPGLSVRVRKDTGNKSFEVVKKVNGSTARSKVCTHGERPYTQGKDSVLVTARAIIAKMDQGITRSMEKAEARAQAVIQARNSLTVEEACDKYISAKSRARNTTEGYVRFRDNGLMNWHKRQFASITEDDVADLFDEVTEEKGPVAANNLIRFFRSVWKHHRRRYGLGECPTVIFTRDGDNVKSWNPEKRRTRYLHHNELEAWWRATERLREQYVGDGELAADYLQFALLTGLRRREIANIRWEDISSRRKTLLIAENKSQRPLVLPITEAMMAILEGRKGEERPFKIEEPKKFIAKVTEWSDIKFSTHDLRRSFLTHATSLGVPLPIQKALVNHSRQADVTDGYIQIDEHVMRDSLEKIQRYILTAAGQTANVILIEASRG